MDNEKCVVLLTAKGSNGYDRLFLVRGTDDRDCVHKFHAFIHNEDNRWELGLDLRTVKYLGDGPARGTVMVLNESGVVELDTSNNVGYDIKVVRD